MRLLDRTFSPPEENLACDEALLDYAEEESGEELLRFWEPAGYFVVLGYSNKAATEVNLAFCDQNNIPVLRRCSGGGTVLQGPGCLNYSLILRIAKHESLSTISGTNAFILERHRDALTNLFGQPIDRAGATDLVIGNLKFSGNAQRRKKGFLLFHGTILLNMNISLIERALLLPSKQPCYRENRAHSDFLFNLKISSEHIKSALVKTWKASGLPPQFPIERIRRLANEKYCDSEWNLRH